MDILSFWLINVYISSDLISENSVHFSHILKIHRIFQRGLVIQVEIKDALGLNYQGQEHWDEIKSKIL